MQGSPVSRNPVFWFIPALLACVLVLAGLCVILLSRQVRHEQNSLREQERVSLDQTQEHFRTEIEKRWRVALTDLPDAGADFAAFQTWDQRLGDSVFGFSLDDSGWLTYPNFQLVPNAKAGLPETKETLSLLCRELENRSPTKYPESSVLSQEESARRMFTALAKGDKDRGFNLALRILKDVQEENLTDAVPLSLQATVVILENEEPNERSAFRQAAMIETWLVAYENGRLPLSSGILPWLKRLQEQCRRRNEIESWLVKEKRLHRKIRQLQWAERFLPRLNLLLRRHLYNAARAELPRQILNSDPAEDPILVLCRFQNVRAMRLVGLAFDLESFCGYFQTTLEHAEWRSEEVALRIVNVQSAAPPGPLAANASLPADLSHAKPYPGTETTAAASLNEQRILDPWTPQFVVEAAPRDPAAFERQTFQKNLMYLTLLVFTIGTCVLVLFFGNRALRDQQHLSKLRTDFLTNVTHELRTPLTAIRLHGETLERHLGSDTLARSSLDTIISEVDRLGLLINDVLEFTRLENQRKRYIWESVDLVPIIHDSVSLFSQQLAELNFEVELKLPESLVLRRADRSALKQCAVNLISNSIKFSPQEKFLAVRLSSLNGDVVWETEDRGIGIAAEDQPRIFEKFYRGEHLDPALSGTGLGLTLCKAFVEAHDGSISWIQPESNQGSRFVIRLPT